MIIYSITNLINGKRYVGQTIRSLRARWRLHCSKHSGCSAIKAAIDKYGRENFKIETLHAANDMDELNSKEIEYIRLFNTIAPNGYNLGFGGDNPVCSEETKKKISKANKGKVSWSKGLSAKSDPRVAKIVRSGERHHSFGKSSHMKGKTHTSETKVKMSLAKIGRKQSKEHRVKISESHKKVKIYCLENNTEYPSISVAAKTLGLNSGNIFGVLSGRAKFTGGYSFVRLESKLHITTDKQ